MTTPKIVPIRDIMPVGKPMDPPPMAKRCGANTAVTWGDLYLLFESVGHAPLAEAVLDKILKIDAA